MAMPMRSSGRGAIPISAIGLGSWHTWDRVTRPVVTRTLALAFEAGINYFDVGIYEDHLARPDPESTEMRFAAAMAELAPARGDWVLAAKGWLPGHSWAGATPLPQQLEILLQRLDTDHADILVLGDIIQPPADYDAILEQIGAILKAGRARAWAVNNWSAAEVETITTRAGELDIQPPEFAQHKYGLVRRSVAEGAPYARLYAEHGIRVQASDVFEGGLLFGPRKDGTPRPLGGDVGRIQERLAAALPRIREAAAGLGATPAQLAIAVPLLHEATANVLIGSRTPEQVRENLGALELLERHPAAEILAAAAPFFLDHDAVDPRASWGRYVGDDAANYIVNER